MKNIKVLAGSLAAITAGATLALGIFAAPITSLGDYVKVSGSSLNSPVIVTGDGGASLASGFAMDVLGAADIAAAVAGYATMPVSTGAVGMAVSGGAEVGSTNTKLYLLDPLTKSGVKATLTKSDLPTILASGTLTDQAGTNYNYDQYLALNGGTTVTYGNSGGDLTDPDFLLNLSTSATAGIYNYTVTFNKLLNVSSTNVQNKKLKLLGVDYTIGATSEYTASTKQLVLYGSSLVQTLAGGEEKEVTVGGTKYTVKFIGASSGTTAYVSVNGNSQSVTKGSSTTVEGLPVYVEDIFYISSTDTTQNSVKLSFGTNKLTLADGATVKKGTADDTVDGTYVTLTGTASSGISKLVVSVAAKDSSHDYAKAGAEGAFVDPVFGAFKIALGGVAGGATEKVTIDNSGTTAATVNFVDYRGNTKTLTWAYTGSSSFAADLNATSTANFVVVENGTVHANDYVLLAPSQESDYSHVMQYTTSSSLASSGAYIELKDVMSDSTSRFYLTDSPGYVTGNLYIDGQQYYVGNVTLTATDTAMHFTWGAGATAVTGVGSKLTVFPLVRTAKGGYLTFVPGNASRQIQITPKTNAFGVTGGTNNLTLELPGGDVVVSSNDTVSTASSAEATAQTSLGAATLLVGRITYNITTANASNSTMISLESGARPAYPAVVFMEEKGKNLANTDVKDFVITTVKDGSGSGVDITVDTPTLTSATQFSQSLQSDNSVTNYVDRYGTMVKYDTDNNGLVEITYPDEQAVAAVAVGESPAFGAGAAGTVQAAVKLTTPVAKLASEVSATAPGADLILVGGPCANTLVAKLLAPSNITCANWAYTTGIIKEVTDGFTDGHKALIVAGTQAADTRALAAKLISGTLTYSA